MGVMDNEIYISSPVQKYGTSYTDTARDSLNLPTLGTALWTVHLDGTHFLTNKFVVHVQTRRLQLWPHCKALFQHNKVKPIIIFISLVNGVVDPIQTKVWGAAVKPANI